MANVDSLRKLIREEVRAVFQEELAGILKEAIMANKGSQVISEVARPKKPQIPGTLNTQAYRQMAPPILAKGNPLNSLLAETAQSMTEEDLEGLGGMQGGGRDIPIVESVGEMFANSRGSSNLEAIQINGVPDFTHLMAKMKANGEI